MSGTYARKFVLCLTGITAILPLVACNLLSPSRREIEDTVHRDITSYYNVEMANCANVQPQGWDCYVTFEQIPDRPRVDGLRIHFVRAKDDVLRVADWEPFG